MSDIKVPNPNVKDGPVEVNPVKVQQEETVNLAATSTDNTSGQTITTPNANNVVADAQITDATYQQMLDILKDLTDHTHTFYDDYGSACQCNCEHYLSEGRIAIAPVKVYSRDGMVAYHSSIAAAINSNINRKNSFNCWNTQQIWAISSQAYVIA
jgi:hypothetical protein